jgi:hypothetical protein
LVMEGLHLLGAEAGWAAQGLERGAPVIRDLLVCRWELAMGLLLGRRLEPWGTSQAATDFV